MLKRVLLPFVGLLVVPALVHAAEGRWSSFAEDADLRYYLDQKSILTLPDSVYVFWMRSVPKDREYVRREYNLNSLSYILTNYELDCSDGTYRVREIAMFDKNRKELSKSVSAEEAPFEPIQPESIVEMAAENFCPKETAAKVAESPSAPADDSRASAPAAPSSEPALQ